MNIRKLTLRILPLPAILFLFACGQDKPIGAKQYLTVDASLTNFNSYPYVDLDTVLYGMSHKNATVIYIDNYSKKDKIFRKIIDTIGSCDCYKSQDTLIVVLKKNTGYEAVF